jgi:hypothetical protein
VKTSIVNSCNCPIATDNSALLYKDSAEQDKILAVEFKFHVGDFVWARKVGDLSGELYKATITAITNGLYTIKFVDGTIETVSGEYISIYYDCNGCVSADTTSKYNLYSLNSETGNISCNLLTILADGQLI